jgi:hypothetical protein
VSSTSHRQTLDVETEYIFLGSEVLTLLTMNNSIFWAVTPCRQVGCHQYFVGTFCLRLQGRRVSQADLLFSGFLHLLLDHEDGGSKFVRNFNERLSEYTASHPRRYYFSSINLLSKGNYFNLSTWKTYEY